jgi:hypothetical protein
MAAKIADCITAAISGTRLVLMLELAIAQALRNRQAALLRRGEEHRRIWHSGSSGVAGTNGRANRADRFSKDGNHDNAE